MKCSDVVAAKIIKESHPTRGGWIEIANLYISVLDLASPTPHGVGGLKWTNCARSMRANLSHPTRGGWIEMAIVARL